MGISVQSGNNEAVNTVKNSDVAENVTAKTKYSKRDKKEIKATVLLKELTNDHQNRSFQQYRICMQSRIARGGECFERDSINVVTF